MKNNYNFIAPFYDQLVYFVFKNEIYRSQIEFIDQLPEKGHILFIGGGSGQVLKWLLEKRPELKVTYLEKSEKMLLLSRKKVSDSKNVSFVLGDTDQLKKLQFDAVLSFYLFDLFSEKEQNVMFQKLNQSLKPKGLWLIADFQPPQNRKHLLIEKAMFIFLKLSTNIQSNSINSIEKLYKKQTFKLKNRKTFYGDFLFSSCFKKSGTKIEKED